MQNETAGEHFTPREVITLMVNILFSEEEQALSGPAPVRTMLDPAVMRNSGVSRDTQTGAAALRGR
jgi:hypothetical protein